MTYIRKPKTIEKVEQTIIKAAGITLQDLYAKVRTKEFVNARHAVWFVATDLLGYSASYLGRLYDVDHSTILHGIRVIKEDKVRREHITAGIIKHCPELKDAKLSGKQKPSDTWRF